MSIALDVAANNFYSNYYNLNKKQIITADELLKTYLSWFKNIL